MSDGDPWIKLQWEEPQTINVIQLTFETGLNRRLFLTGNDSVYYDQIRSVQPESIRQHVIEALINNIFVPVVRVDDNYVRLNRHHIEPVTTTAIRVRVLQTQGDDLARIFEIRRCGA